MHAVLNVSVAVTVVTEVLILWDGAVCDREGEGRGGGEREKERVRCTNI